MHMRDLPNLLSLARILLVPFVLWLLLGSYFFAALLLYALAGLTDGLDGYLARRYGWQTRLGAMLDPLGDKLLQASCYGALGYLGMLPWWLVALVLGRDGVIIAGALLYRFLIGSYDFGASWLSKINTVLQLLLPVLILINQVMPLPDYSWINGMIYLVALTTLLSGGHYILEWSRRALRARKIISR